MPKADWKKCAVCVGVADDPDHGVPAASPGTGRGDASYSTSPTSCWSWSRSRSARRSSSFRVCSRLMASAPPAVGTCVRSLAPAPIQLRNRRARTGQSALIGLADRRAAALCRLHSTTEEGSHGRARPGRPGRGPADGALREHPRAGGAGAVPRHRRGPRHRAARLQRLEDGRRDHRVRARRRPRRGRLRRARPSSRWRSRRARWRTCSATWRRSPACSRRTPPPAAATCSAGSRPLARGPAADPARPRPLAGGRPLDQRDRAVLPGPWRTLPLLQSEAAAPRKAKSRPS